MNHQFYAPAPEALDLGLCLCATWVGLAYMAFVIDAVGAGSRLEVEIVQQFISHREDRRGNAKGVIPALGANRPQVSTG